MLSVFAITTPIFLLIIFGFVAVKAQVISAEVNSGLGRFVFYFAMPAMMFRSLSSLEFNDLMSPTFLGAYAIGSLLVFSLGLLASRQGMLASGFPAALAGMGMASSNSAYFGFPVMLLVFANPPVKEFAMVLLVENLLMMPLAFALLEYGARRDDGLTGLAFWKPILKRVLGSPVLLAIVFGVSASLLQVRLPEAVDQSLAMLGRAAAPVALFMIGGSLVGASLRGTGRQTAVIVIGKLVLHPLLVALMLSVLPGVDPQLKVVAILFAAMPMLSIYPVVGGVYGQQMQSSAVLLVTTVAAFFSISLILNFLR